MLLISKFSDYYEASGLHYGVDNHLTYNRRTETVDNNLFTSNQHAELQTYLKDIKRGLYFSYGDIGYDFFHLLGFCGKVYPCFHFYNINKKYDYWFCKSDNLIGYLQTNGLYEEVRLILYAEKGKKSLKEKFDRTIDCIKPLSNSFFETVQAPVFLYSNNVAGPSITINPCLKDYGFQHYIDSVTAYQEITMYLGKLNNRELDYSVGGDKVLAKSKGFDKLSFTQVSPNKKQRRKLRKQ